MSSDKAFPDEQSVNRSQLLDYTKCNNLEEVLILVIEQREAIERLRAALEFYAGYMDGDNPEFTKGGWQKYPDPKIAKEVLAGGKDASSNVKVSPTELEPT